MLPIEISLRLERLNYALRLLDADITRLRTPILQQPPSQFMEETGIMVDRNGQHHPVPYYTQDVKAALSLPGANPDHKHALLIVTAWLREKAS